RGSPRAGRPRPRRRGRAGARSRRGTGRGAASCDLLVQGDVRLRRCVPGELLAGAACPRACLVECGRVGEGVVGGLREAVGVARGNYTAGSEVPYGLRDAADVVRDRGHAGAERAQESAALVEFGPVREDGDRRLAERTVDLLAREVAEPPLDLEPARG